MKRELTDQEIYDKYDEPRLHMEQILSTYIMDFGVPMRIAIPLDDAGIRRMRDLLKCTKEDLLKVKRLGEKSVEEILHTLERFDLHLGMLS